MIPTIGLIIASYAFFRAVESILLKQDRFHSKSGYAISAVLAVIVMAVAAIGGADLLAGGSSGLEGLR